MDQHGWHIGDSTPLHRTPPTEGQSVTNTTPLKGNAVTDDFNPWAFTSGLIDDVDGTIKDPFFAFDPNYMDGTRLVLKFTILTGDDDNPEEELMYPCGAGWEPKDGGARAVREDEKQKAFNKSSGMGLLCTAAIEAGADGVLMERGTPMDAAIWDGLAFHWNRKTFKYGGDIGDKERLVPTAFKGTIGASGGSGGGGGSGAAATSTPAPAAAPAAAAPAATPTTEAPVTGKLRVNLIKLAKACATHDDFMEKAYEMPDVLNSPTAQALVDTPGALYNDARAGA